MEKNNIEYERKEICLLDVFAFFVRYRKPIVFSTLIGFIISVLSFFIIPKVFKLEKEKKVLVIYTGNIEKMAPELSSYLNMDLNLMAEKEFKDYKNFAQILKNYNVFFDEELTDREYNTFVKKTLDERKTFFISVFPKNNSFQISAEIPESKVDIYKAFVNNYINFCSDLLEDKMNNVLHSSEANLDEILSRTEENKSSDYAKLISVRLAIKNFNDNHSSICSLDNNPFESDVIQKIGRLKKTVILTAVFFFLSLVISLILKFTEVIKNDPVSSKVISDAWKAGK